MLKKLIAAAGLACMTLLPQAQAEETTIRFSNWLPPTHPITTDILYPWAENVAAATEGRVTIQFIPALGKPPAHFDLVRDGVADAAMSVHAYTADRFPSAYGMTMPGYADDATSGAVAFWRTYEKFFKPLGEFKDVQLLGLWTHGPGHIYTKDKEIKSFADAKGLRLRATGGIVQDIAEKLDIVPQFASASEAYELMSRGVVDGVMFNSDSVVSFRMLDILNNAFRVPGGLYRDTHYVIMNKDVYAGLSDADRAALDKVSGEAMARLAGQAWDTVEDAAWVKMKEAGYTIHVASDADVAKLAELAEPLKQGWIARMKDLGVDGQASLDYFAQEIAAVKAGN